jgi:hypothetical protein
MMNRGTKTTHIFLLERIPTREIQLQHQISGDIHHRVERTGRGGEDHGLDITSLKSLFEKSEYTGKNLSKEKSNIIA